jgi:serine/threonine protein kinase
MLMSDGALFVGPIDDPRRYQINAEWALNPLEGGEGLVYSGVDSRSGERVAVKMLTTARPDDYGRVVSRLLPFIEIDHPNVMQQRDVFLGAALASDPPDDPVEYENIYSVADWIDGEPLSQMNHDDDWRSAFTALSGLARGLATLADHRSDVSPRGLVHRDVKPSNVRLTPDGQLVLIDLGVARPLDDDDLTKGVGTYRWRAPEVLSGAAPTTAATDAWGLGAIAYWLLVGEPPGLEGAATARERILASQRTRQLNDPAGIATHIAQLLQTTPAERPGDLNKWARQLDAILTHRTTRTQRRIATGATLLAIPAIALTLLVARVNPTAQSEAPTTTGETTQTLPLTTNTTSTTTIPLSPAPLIPELALPVVESITADTQRPQSLDNCSNLVTYEPDKLVDGDRSSAWMAEGDGTGQTIYIDLQQLSIVRRVGLIPGYDKYDPCSGRDRYWDLRRVTAVRWSFDDGSSFVQTFSPSRQLQILSLGEGVVTSTVQITILGTTQPGLARLDHTPISEIVIR